MEAVSDFSQPRGPDGLPALHVGNIKAGVYVPLPPHAKLYRG